MIDVSTRVVNNKVKLYLNTPSQIKPKLIGAVSLTDSAHVVTAKTKKLIEEMQNIVHATKVPYAISEVFNEKGQLRNIRLGKRGRGWQWQWLSGNNIKRQENFDPQRAKAYIEFYTMVALGTSNIPENSITALVVRGIITTMVKQTAMKCK